MNRLLAAIAAFTLLAASTLPISAADTMQSHIKITSVWTKASIGVNGAAYATVENHGNEMDRLVAVETNVADKAEIHTHLMEDGVMKMRRIVAIEVHPGAPAILKPGGDHLMLFKMKRKWVEGEEMPLTLVFEKAGKIDVLASVKAWGASGMQKMQHDGEGHKKSDEHKHGS